MIRIVTFYALNLKRGLPVVCYENVSSLTAIVVRLFGVRREFTWAPQWVSTGSFVALSTKNILSRMPDDCSSS